MTISKRRGNPGRARFRPGAIALPAWTACLAVAGCSPVATVERYGVEATLVDRGNGEPLRRSAVAVRVDGVGFERRTDRTGEFRVPPQRKWYWSWLGGPAWLSDPEAEVEIRCEGFEPLRFGWSRHLRNDRDFPEEAGVIRMGVVGMDRW